MKLAVRDRRFEAFGLVDGEPCSFRMLARKFGNMLVCCGQSAAAINHDNCDIGFLQRANRLVDHGFFNPLLTTGNAAGIDNQVRNRAQFTETVFTVSCQPRVVRNKRIARARQSIK